MAGKRISPRRLSTSQAAKKHLKDKKRKGKHGAVDEKPAIKFSRLDIWLITIAAVVVLGFLIAMLVTQVS